LQTSYYNFVFNPDKRTGFAYTVENMYHVSLLANQGLIDLIEDGDDIKIGNN